MLNGTCFKQQCIGKECETRRRSERETASEFFFAVGSFVGILLFFLAKNSFNRIFLRGLVIFSDKSSRDVVHNTLPGRNLQE